MWFLLGRGLDLLTTYLALTLFAGVIIEANPIWSALYRSPVLVVVNLMASVGIFLVLREVRSRVLNGPNVLVVIGKLSVMFAFINIGMLWWVALQ